jgi:hypothetical protein
MLSDVTQTGGAQEGVDYRVSQHVSVAMAGEPRLAFKLDSAQHQTATFPEAVDIETYPDAHLAACFSFDYGPPDR